MISIDGSMGEGGGQVVRTAVSLAAHTGQPVEITRLRERRDRPGLQPQHLAAVLAAARICDATTEGAEVGSRRLTFVPSSRPRPGDYVFDITTAGATTLVLQTVLVPLLLAGGQSTIEVIGGTHQPMAPTADYIEHVYVPSLRSAGAQIEVDYGPAGYYPRGGGHLRAVIGSADLAPFDFTQRGENIYATAHIITSRLPDHVAERGAKALTELLPHVEHVMSRLDAASPGAAITITAQHDAGFAGVSAIGRPGVPMEMIAEEACDLYAAWEASGAACDERLADQLVLPAALIPGRSRWTTPRETLHLQTVLAVTQAFVPITWRISDGCVDLTVPPS